MSNHSKAAETSKALASEPARPEYGRVDHSRERVKHQKRLPRNQRSGRALYNTVAELFLSTFDHERTSRCLYTTRDQVLLDTPPG